MNKARSEDGKTVPASPDKIPLLPARMVNEYEYCPRLAYLEWVQGEWADSADTVEGRYRHRRVDKPSGKLATADELDEDTRLHARSVELASEKLGLIAKMDLVEAEGSKVTPVDYKRGKRPHIAKGAYEPERIQLCVQGLILQEQGYACDEGALYFIESKERVPVVFDEELRQSTQAAIEGLRKIASSGKMPPPLEDSPKCPRCSLVAVCLPDEVHYLRKQKIMPRPMAIARDEKRPVYVQATHAKVKKNGETLEIHIEDSKVSSARVREISQLVLFGNVYVTTPTLHELMRRDIPVSWYSYGNWFLGHTVSTSHKNVELRSAQYRASFETNTCLSIARQIVHAKICNSRTFLRRNWRGDAKPDELITALKHDSKVALRCKSLAELLGVEGAAASRYFSAFPQLIKHHSEANTSTFDFRQRNRRPPTDPVNTLLSFSYAMLTRVCCEILSAVGFDHYRGFYHQPRYGRPALALDMMEAFRPVIADSCVIQAINNREIRERDFISKAGRVALTPEGRKRIIDIFERRLNHEITHPLFGYTIGYRGILEIQARLLGRYLLGDIPEYPEFRTR